ncbi:cyclin-dependent kinase-like 2 isoform X1 [Leptinotarsa decemlineata]|uniref:cyclin-dependent kinase-like 2 isoform X1 n=1 Tax=Leptinotarsa decemlineata TaxID=7539 RepID=UPI003D308A40
MEKYEQLSIVGEGSYGLVMKCRHRETDQIVAVKKFLETEEDATIRKMALREIRMLKRLKHENLVTMIEVFRHRKRFYLVFEYLEGTVLDELEKMPHGLGDERCRERIFQVTRGISYCHSNNIIHRDVKPENVLVSSLGVVKLCDFGFARLVSATGEACTEYVATRWYRAPELLVAEPNYGPPIDIWAIGCLFAEMMTGDPLFPGESDIDQFHLIVKLLGKPCSRHEQLLCKNTEMKSAIKVPVESNIGFYKHFSTWPTLTIEFLEGSMNMDPQQRLSADDLLKHPYFTHDMFPQRFLPALRDKVNIELNSPLLRKFKTEILMATDKKDESKRKMPQKDSKWRFSFAEGTMKRKLSNEIMNNESLSDKNLISLTKTAQRLNGLQQRSSQKQSSFSKDKSGKNLQTNSNSSELQMMEKSLESLIKFNKHPSGNQKDDSFLPDTSPPTSFHFEYGDYSRSPNSQTVLHPSINNISFSRDPLKKSPNVLHNMSSTNTKPVQVPLLTNPRTQFLKKLERNVVVENIFGTGDKTHVWNNGPIWLNSFTTSFYKKKEAKTKTDDFSLPNLPGATNNRMKKRNSPEKQMPRSNEITPAYRYMKAKRKRNTLDISLPFPVREDG